MGKQIMQKIWENFGQKITPVPDNAIIYPNNLGKKLCKKLGKKFSKKLGKIMQKIEQKVRHKITHPKMLLHPKWVNYP